MKSYLFFTAFLFTLGTSQQFPIPADLAAGFSSSGTQGLQVSFGGDASEGITNGETVNLEDARNPPTFALGDSSGVNRAISYTILMLDTTDNNARKVQFLQSGFRATGDKTKLETQEVPIIPYEAPSPDAGPRQFSFLLYQHQGQQPAQLKAESNGDAGPFDVKAFESANNLKPARAGIALLVRDSNYGQSQDSPTSESKSNSVPPATGDPSTSTSASIFVSVLTTNSTSTPTSSSATTTRGALLQSLFPLSASNFIKTALSTSSSASTVSASPSNSSLSSSPSVSTQSSHSSLQTQTTTVVVTAITATTSGATAGAVSRTAVAISSNESVADALYDSMYSGVVLATVVLLVQAAWYTLVL
ncbi:uncharacterized protein PADG_04717 [Paracoccidioides brasiliensis Pb18]|uniref:Uncharacterized protein n=1 Tax=Paracoccidioides brasiliensis (strain Pb18) TaxID=502780 RepID=C1GCJ5_PARBD|nr:uncharacterized protein PADG_04717 [Paracoccidioides brasiliensis Pb18]EEH48638.1 hypothetical protein PADG_04717 [Paracoccidioides brasiliensis Pb18]ODH52686.1 hypothetical protein GX48_01172 [Paracoccidioides brasiliensis]